MLGINAGAAEEEQFFDTVAVGTVDQRGLHLKVGVKELGGVGVIGVNAPHLSRGNENVFGRLGLVEGINGCMVQKIQFSAGAADQFRVALGFECAPDRAAYHAAVAGDVNAGGSIHECGDSGYCGCMDEPQGGEDDSGQATALGQPGNSRPQMRMRVVGHGESLLVELAGNQQALSQSHAAGSRRPVVPLPATGRSFPRTGFPAVIRENGGRWGMNGVEQKLLEMREHGL